jgi:hypothetical protein
MTNPTSNFGWQMPTSTDLVTDLPADFEVFGQAVDTDFVDLLGGTTGQVLSKTSATDLDFTWIANDQGDITGVTAGTGISVASPTGPVPTVSIDTAVTADLTTAQTLTNKTLTSPALTTPTISTLTTNGDLLYGTGSGALARKAIGSTGQVLTVAAGIPSWATPASASPASGVNRVATQESTTSTSFVNLTTTQAVTLTTGTKALVSLSCQIVANGTTEQPCMSVAITGASSVSAASSISLNTFNTAAQQAYGISILFTGLTAGSNVFTAKFADLAGTTSSFQNREISVIDLGS